VRDVGGAARSERSPCGDPLPRLAPFACARPLVSRSVGHTNSPKALKRYGIKTGSDNSLRYVRRSKQTSAVDSAGRLMPSPNAGGQMTGMQEQLTRGGPVGQGEITSRGGPCFPRSMRAGRMAVPTYPSAHQATSTVPEGTSVVAHARGTGVGASRRSWILVAALKG